MSCRVNRNSTSNSEVKKFCGVCQKAGLSEREYTSHFTKSSPGPQGIVTCPTILNNECRICFQFGHFKSACPVLAEKERLQKKSDMQERRTNFKKQPIATLPIKDNRGGFSALFDSNSDSDSESDMIVVSGAKRTFAQASKPLNKPIKVEPKKEEWPALTSKPVVKQEPTEKLSFATVISNPAPVKKIENSRPNICGFKVLTTSKDGNLTETPLKKWTKFQNWADVESSDDEDDTEHIDNTAW